MADFVTIKMKEEADWQAIIDALPEDTLAPIGIATNVVRNPLKKLNVGSQQSASEGKPLLIGQPASEVVGQRVNLLSLGIRSFRRNDGQAIYMEHWDGVSGVVDIEDILLLDPVALAANKGRIKFLLTDEVQASLEVGPLRALIDAGFFENEGFTSYP